MEVLLEYLAKGFMTMAPFTDDESLIRKSFITLRDLSEKMKKALLLSAVMLDS